MENRENQKLSDLDNVETKVIDVSVNRALTESYQTCLQAFLSKLGWTEEQKNTHPLNDPLHLFYKEGDHVCSVTPYTDPDQKDAQPACMVNDKRFSVYLKVFYQIPEQEETAQEREALYNALEELILKRKRTKAEEAREELLKASPAIGMFLACQEWMPILYQSEEGNPLVDMAAVQAVKSYGMQPYLLEDRIQPAGDFFAVFGKEELEKVPDGLIPEYVKQLKAEGTNRIQKKSYVNCLIQTVCGTERSPARMLPECQVFQKDQLAVLKKVPLQEHTLLFEPNPEQFLAMSYDLENKHWRIGRYPAFSMEVPVKQANSVDQDQRHPVVQTAVYDRKVMPAGGSREKPKISPEIVNFFQAACGGSAPMIQRLAKFFAAVMEQDCSGLTVLLSKHQKNLLQKTLLAVFDGCAVHFQGETDRKTDDFACISVEELDEKAFAVMYRAQLMGRSLVFLKDKLPEKEKVENFHRLLRGDKMLVKYRPELTEPQVFHNHLHFAAVTDQADTSHAFADELGAKVLDFTSVEQKETITIQFSDEDLEWFRAKFLLYGMKLLTMETAADQSQPPETAEEDLRGFLESL